jgi:UDP-N-acetylmuramyl pentapeptide phosphotransferase/UDP-N-acetylglucosamine-1-phosphate transferase
MHIAVSWQLLPEFAIVGLAAAVLCAALIVALMPLMLRYAMAKPNARSSHVTPTPQGGGMAVVAAVILLGIPTMLFLPGFDPGQIKQLWVLFGTTALLAVVGAIDDIRTIEAIPRLIFQFLAVGIVVMLLPEDVRVLPAAPLWLERTLAIFAGVWCVNLANFMDGIDCMTVTEFVPLAVALCMLGIIGVLPQAATLIAFALLGAMIGFAPFNRPVARLFLGDVGSLPLGLLMFWLLLQLASRGHFAAALLLPLYYLADATLTLLLRIFKGASIMTAHREHFYQQAIDRGLPVKAVIGRIGAVNIVLTLLALASAALRSPMFDIAALVAGGALVAILLRNLARSAR